MALGSDIKTTKQQMLIVITVFILLQFQSLEFGTNYSFSVAYRQTQISIDWPVKRVLYR